METMHPTVNQEPQSRAYSSESFRQHEPNRSRSRSPPSRHFNRTGEEYQELELAHKIKMLEELEWERAGTTRYDISGLPSRATEDVKCGPVRNDEGPPMPKKSILKKQSEPIMDTAIGIEVRNAGKDLQCFVHEDCFSIFFFGISAFMIVFMFLLIVVVLF